MANKTSKAMAKKASMGRQRIKIAKIEKPNHRQVTFSKRRSGLFKKACELCTLCGVEIGIVVFSPAHKVFSFGHPNVDSLVEKFLFSRSLSATTATTGSACANASVRELNAQLTRVEEGLEVERGRKEAMEERVGECWWEAPLEKMGWGELQRLATALEDLKERVALQIKIVGETTSSSSAGFDSVGYGFGGVWMGN